jgi:hypothetical protein
VGNASESTTYSEEDWARMLATQREQEAKQDLEVASIKGQSAKDITLMSSIGTFLKDPQERIKRGKALMQTKQNERAAEIEFANAKWVLTQAEEKIKTLEKDYPMEAMDLKSKLIVVKQVLEANQKNKSNSPVNFFKNFFKKEKSAEDIRLIWSIEKFLKEAHERIERGGDELNAKWFLTQAEEKINTLEKNHPTDAKALKNKLIAVKKELEPNKKSEPNNLANFLKGLYDKLFK